MSSNQSSGKLLEGLSSLTRIVKGKKEYEEEGDDDEDADSYDEEEEVC